MINAQALLRSARHIITPFSLGVFGIITSCVLFAIIHNIEEETETERFRLATSILDQSIYTGIDELESTTMWMQMLFNTLGILERDQFSLASSKLLAFTHNIKTIGWIPRIPPHKVSDYKISARRQGIEDFLISEASKSSSLIHQTEDLFPVFFIVPYSNNEKLLGLNLGDIPSVAQAFESARNRNQLTIISNSSAHPELLSEGDILGIMPTYTPWSDDFTQHGRRQNLEGYVFVITQLLPILQSQMSSSSLQGVGLTLNFKSNDNNIVPMLKLGAHNNSKHSYIAQQDRVFTNTYGQWITHYAKLNSFSHMNQHNKSWLVLFGGIVITALAAYSMNTTFSKQRMTEKQLQLIEVKYAQIFQHAHDAIFLHDFQGKILDANKQCEVQTGYSLTELLSMSIIDLHNQVTSKLAIAALDTVIDKGLANFETILLCKNGSQFPAEVNAHTLNLSGTSVIQCVIHNITDRLDIERIQRERDILHARERQLKNIASKLGEGLLLLDKNGRITYVNPEAEKLLRWKENELNGKLATQTILATLTQTHYPISAYSPLTHAVKSRVALRTESLTFTRKDGTSFTASIIATPLPQDSDENAAIVAFRNIDNRILAEQEITRGSKLLNAINSLLACSIANSGHNAALAICLTSALTITDSTLAFVWSKDGSQNANCTWSDSTGAIKHISLDSNSPRHWQTLDQLCRKAHAESLSLTLNSLVITDHNANEWISSLLAIPLYGTSGPIGIIAVANRTQLYTGKHENDLNRIIEAYSQVTIYYKTQALLTVHSEKLKRSNKDLERFAYIASHDLQEPLRKIAGYCELLARRYKGKLDKDADQFIAYAIDGAKRMQSLIKDLLNYSRIAGESEQLSHVDSNQIITQIINDIEHLLNKSHAEITLDNLPSLIADPRQIRQLFHNLITNAIKYRRQEVPLKLQISGESNNTHIIIHVHDNGLGIKEEYQNRIFDMFQRLHGKTEYTGNGIGLAICKRIMERHSGEITVTSIPGEGSTFSCSFPKIQ